MADRSRASVDAAAESGAEPSRSAVDDEGTTPGRQTDAPSATGTEEPERAVALAPTRHSGDRIANRYRLEECITQAGVFTSWRAVDEKLHRAVGVHLLAAGHLRARRALDAARSAALLVDPRFVQVLDAVQDGELVYVVREWLPDATDLGTLLARGPLEAHEAYQMVRQVTEAVAAAHRRGLCHLRLTPACVLRTDSGQYRINGIAVNAALHGLPDDDRTAAEREDTRAIGALLFAALTGRWPAPEEHYGLPGLPRELGQVRPDQVRADVHRGLSDLAAQTLLDEPGRHLEPITSPDALAKAVALLPRVRAPEPEPPLPPAYATPGLAGGGRQHPGGPGRPATPQEPPLAVPPALPGRTGKLIKWAVAAVVVAAVGLGSWGLSEAVLHGGTRSGANVQSDTGSTSGANLGSSGGGTSPGTVSRKPLPLAGATEFSPLGSAIAPAKASLAIDGDPGTSWTTDHFYGYANFGNLTQRADGSGIVVDLGSVKNVSGVTVTLPFGGQTVEVLAAPAGAATEPNQLDAFSQTLSAKQVTTTSLKVTLDKPVRTRYILVHITSLAPEDSSSGSYHGGISEIQVLG